MEEKSLIKISLFICMSGDTGLEIITAPRSAAGSERIPKFGRAKWLYKDQRLCLRMSKVFFLCYDLKSVLLKKRPSVGMVVNNPRNNYICRS